MGAESAAEMELKRVTFVAARERNPGRYRSDPSYIYRCENLGLALARRGVKVSHVHQSELDCRDQQVVVFHRPMASLHLSRVVRRCRQNGALVLADFDDLIFDPSLASYSPGVMNGLVSERRTRKMFRAHARAMEMFDGVMLSTSALADEFRRCFPYLPQAVIHNAVHDSWRDKAVGRVVHDGLRKLTYFPGTRSHDRDFALIRQPLEQFLRGHPDVILELVGPLAFRLDVPQQQVVHRERVPFGEYSGVVSHSWINLAPLEPTRFNHSKSALKALEAGYFSVPTICSANPDYERLKSAGALIASTPQSWTEHLEKLMDVDEYRRVTEGLSARTLALADVEQQVDRMLDFVSALRDEK